jgi:heme exporter protein D
MNWNGLSDFLHMGGYALYVWGSFGVTAALVAGELWMLKRHREQALKQARLAVEFGRFKDEDAE